MQVEFQAYAYKTTYSSPIGMMLAGEVMPHICEASDMSDGQYTKDWARIGTVRVIVDFDDNNTIVANQIEALKVQLNSVRAENYEREQMILNQIKNLQAIEYTPAADRGTSEDIPF